MSPDQVLILITIVTAAWTGIGQRQAGEVGKGSWP